jgi:gliding motility-associated-like protein
MKKYYLLLRLKSTILLCGFLFMSFSFASAQGVNKPGQTEKEVAKIMKKIWLGFMAQKPMNKADGQMFVEHYFETSSVDRGNLYKAVEDGSINDYNADSYINSMITKYVALYEGQYSLLSKEERGFKDPGTGVITWPGACNTACTNTGFENGTLSNWMACEAQVTTPTTSGPFSITTPTCTGILGGGTTAAVFPGTNLPQAQITTAGAVDPVWAGLPQQCPTATYPGCPTTSVEIGDYNNAQYGCGIMEQAFTVTPTNCDFTYYYACVLENPPGHGHYGQPYFNVFMYDANNNPIPFCGNYSVYADSAKTQGNFKGIYYAADGDTCYCRPWTRVFVPLKAYIGQCVTIKVLTADCYAGGHFGYAYFTANCTSLGIITSAAAICGKPITLTGPNGGAAYKWSYTGGGTNCITPAAGNTQTITVSCPGKYQVIVYSYIGATCADTLDTVITSSVAVPPVPNFKSDTVCAGNPTLFTNLTTGGGATNTYNWTFSNGTSSTATNPTVTFASAGNYTATLQAMNGGCGGDTSFPVVVTGPPTAGFTAPTVCQNSPTGFTNTSTGGAVVFHWNFGDGNTSAAASPTHTYAACGTYSVVMVAGTAPCVDTAKQVVTVNPNPTPAFSASPVCLGSNTILTDTSKIGCGGTEASWSWMFGDPASGGSNTSNVQNPTHVFSDTGCYAVFFKITTNGGCKDSITKPVCIVGPPVPKFTSGPVCLGQPTLFTNQTKPNPTTSKWYFGDALNSTSALTNPSFTYTAAGTYTVKLVVSSGAGCVDSTTSTVTVNPPPTSGFTVNTVCQGTPTVFTDTSHGGATYSWTFGDGKGTSTAQSPTYTYAASGTFQVKEVVTTAGGCKDSITLPAIVNPNPTATITVPPVCLGTPSVFTLTPTNNAGGTYAWTMGDGVGTSTAQNPSYTYTANGAYTASVTLTSANTCVGTATVVAVVNPIPVPDFSAPPVCLGKSTSFNGKLSTIANIPAPQSIKTYAWAFGDGGTATGPTVTHPYSACGAYSATLITTSAAGCIHDTVIEDTVHPVPVPSFTATKVCKGLPNTFTDQSTIGCGGVIVSWNWNFGDGSPASTVQNPTHTFPSAGTYNVTLTVTSNKAPFCDSAITLPVTVYPIPVPAFTSTNPCFGTATVFTNNSTVAGGTVTSAWRFGDPAGGTSATTSPTYTYGAAGTYNVTLTVTSNFGCVDSITNPTVVHPIPVPLFASDTVGCVPLCIPAFRDSSTVAFSPPNQITTYSWNFGDGSSDSTGTGANPSHCYTKVGTFSPELTVTTNFGCSASNTLVNYITTWPIPVARFTASPNPTDTLAPTVVFTDASQGNPVWWMWTFGDITDSIELTQNTTHTYLYTGTFQDTGTYLATLFIKNKYGCKDSITEPITITPFWTFYIPNAFTPNGDGLNDGFIGKGVGIRNYEMWIFDRWGQQLYHCTSMSQPWDGTVHGPVSAGAQCQEDTYVYLIQIIDIFHNSHRYVGRVTIIR